LNLSLSDHTGRGGLSVHAQVLADRRYRSFLVRHFWGKLMHGMLSAAFTFLICGLIL
jgi:uncharacterized membrane protein